MTWLRSGTGVEVTRPRERQQQLLAAVNDPRGGFGGVEQLALDEALRERYARAGIDAVFFSWSIIPPDRTPDVQRFRMKPAKWGRPELGENGLYVEASFVDRPDLSMDELNQYLGQEARRVLEG